MQCRNNFTISPAGGLLRRRAGLRQVRWLVGLYVLSVSAPAPALGQAALPAVLTAPGEAEATLTPQQLDRLVKPVALYPDQVLADILAAATYPAEVVEAARFVADPAHAGMDGAALTASASGEDWDASVKALLMFPPVLQMMDSDLAWTEHLGRAFIAQQADVMNAVQRLRQAAAQAGALANGPFASVVNEGGDIVIGPPSPQDFYLPSYQPDCVFGPDPACGLADAGIYWGTGFFLPYGYGQWGFVDWRRRNIRLDHPAYGDASAGLAGVWRHRAMGRGAIGAQGVFNYAPAANVPFARQGNFVARNFAPTRLAVAPVARGVASRAPVLRGASLPHVSGAGHR